MRFAALAVLAALMILQAPAQAQDGPQKVPAEPPLEAIVAHFFPGYAPVALGDLAPEVGALTVQDRSYDHSDRSPTVIRADFDGNGYADFALLIKKRSESGDDEIFTILMGHGQGRFAKAMESFFGKLARDIYLGFIPAGAEISRVEASPATNSVPQRLAGPAVTLNVLSEASDAFFWNPERGQFSRESIAD